MDRETEEDKEETLCSVCAGSGEGMHADTICIACRGIGVIRWGCDD